MARGAGYHRRMKTLTPLCATIGLALFEMSCASYSGVSKSSDGALYISGATNYFVFSEPWVRRCEVDGMKLNCVELSESPRVPRGEAGGTAAPAASGTTSAPPEAPVAAPEPAPTPAKSKK